MNDTTKPKIKVLIVGGSWDYDGGKASWYIEQMDTAVRNVGKHVSVNCYNGGNYFTLRHVIDRTPDYDIVFWFANVDNRLEKIRDVKAVAPYTMLVTSKRNDNNKYDFQELVQRALASKSNLMFEFCKKPAGEHGFTIRVFDPLACQFYYGEDITAAAWVAMNRLEYLRSITRQKTISNNTSAELALTWYFDSFKQDMSPSDKTYDKSEIPEETVFIDIVRHHAETFHALMPTIKTERFLGNCSMKPMPPQVGRCSKGMPSFKHGDYVFVSQRNINKEFIDISHFVPTYMDENENIFFCGENKPSVDTPIQLRLYKALPNIRYMLHSHCYIEDAEFTTKSIPCGAVEEVTEILELIDKNYGDRELEFYAINLKGHGSIVMSKDCVKINDVHYYKRPMPEAMNVIKERK